MCTQVLGVLKEHTPLSDILFTGSEFVAVLDPEGTWAVHLSTLKRRRGALVDSWNSVFQSSHLEMDFLTPSSHTESTFILSPKDRASPRLLQIT